MVNKTTNISEETIEIKQRVYSETTYPDKFGAVTDIETEITNKKTGKVVYHSKTNIDLYEKMQSQPILFIDWLIGQNTEVKTPDENQELKEKERFIQAVMTGLLKSLRSGLR